MSDSWEGEAIWTMAGHTVEDRLDNIEEMLKYVLKISLYSKQSIGLLNMSDDDVEAAIQKLRQMGMDIDVDELALAQRILGVRLSS